MNATLDLAFRHRLQFADLAAFILNPWAIARGPQPELSHV